MVLQLSPGTGQVFAFGHKRTIARLGVRRPLTERREDPIRVEPAGCFAEPDGGPVTAPRPVLDALDHTGSKRVEDDVARQFQQVIVLLHEDSLVAALKDMP